MRVYGRVETAMWNRPKMRRLSDRAKLLWVYLLSCPHGNSLGCFVLHDGYIMADLNWPAKQVSEHVSELVSEGMIERCGTTFLTRIVGWFGHNTIDNGKVAIGAAKTIETLPRCEVFLSLIQSLRDFDNEFMNKHLTGIDTGIDTRMHSPEPEPEPEPELGIANAIQSTTPSPAPDMIAIWKAELPTLPQPRGNIPDTRKRNLELRFRDTFENDLERWREFCRTIRGSPHLMGDNDRGWTAFIDWVLNPTNAVKVLEGNYLAKPQRVNRDGNGRGDVVDRARAWLGDGFATKLGNWGTTAEDDDPGTAPLGIGDGRTGNGPRH